MESADPRARRLGKLQVKFLLRQPLLELRVWILELVFGNFGGPFWPILADWGASGPQQSILDDLTDLGTQNESSGARSVNDSRKCPISTLRNRHFRVSISYPEVS